MRDGVRLLIGASAVVAVVLAVTNAEQAWHPDSARAILIVGGIATLLCTLLFGGVAFHRRWKKSPALSPKERAAEIGATAGCICVAGLALQSRDDLIGALGEGMAITGSLGMLWALWIAATHFDASKDKALVARDDPHF